MTTYHKTQKSIPEYAADLGYNLGLLFQNRSLRDQVAAYLKRQGIATIRSSSRNQLIHPDYVDDYVGTVETGFGNTMHRTYFKALYHLRRA